MRRLGSSCDWSQEYFTMDSTRSQIVERVFVELFNQGLVYRGKKLVNWDPVLKTAVSDLEVISDEEQGFMWEIRYPLINNNSKVSQNNDPKKIDKLKYITIATTRPETLLGDVAIAVHPSDKRYQNLIGSRVKVPILERSIPIISDESVEIDFELAV